MERENRVAVVTDSAASIRQGELEAKNLNVRIVPLDIEFWDGNKYVSQPDNTISADAFYERVRQEDKLPKTSGAATPRLIDVFRSLGKNAESIVSIHVTSKMSGVWNSAVLAKNIVQEEGGRDTDINIVDSKLVSLAQWFCVETAAKLAKMGVKASEILDSVNHTIENTQLYITLATLENLRKGGRGKEVVEAMLASLLNITPIIGFNKLGVIGKIGAARSVEKARNRMIEMVGDAGKLAKVAVIHTNALDAAQKIKESLAKIYNGSIPIYDAGPALWVHAGDGGVGVAFKKI